MRKYGIIFQWDFSRSHGSIYQLRYGLSYKWYISHMNYEESFHALLLSFRYFHHFTSHDISEFEKKTSWVPLRYIVIGCYRLEELENHWCKLCICIFRSFFSFSFADVLKSICTVFHHGLRRNGNLNDDVSLLYFHFFQAVSFNVCRALQFQLGLRF